MNRSMLFFIAVASLVAGWGNAILSPQNIWKSAASGSVGSALTDVVRSRAADAVKTMDEKNMESSSVPERSLSFSQKEKKSILVGDHQEVSEVQSSKQQALTAEVVTSQDLDKGEQENQKRISKIEELVKSSITEDDKRLAWLNENEEKINLYLSQLRTKKNKLKVRIHKLERIARVFEGSKKIEKLKNVVTTQKQQEFSNSYDQFVADFGFENAEMSTKNNKLELNINLDNLLIRDQKRVRVSHDLSALFVKFIDQFKGASRGVDEVVLVTTQGAKRQSVSILKDYLTRQFGWKVNVLKGAKSGEEKFPVALKLVSQLKANQSQNKMEF